MSDQEGAMSRRRMWKRLRPWPGAGLLACVCALAWGMSAGCSGDAPPVPASDDVVCPDLALPDQTMHKVVGRRPFLWLRGHWFEGQLSTPDSIRLDGDYDLEFVPFVGGEFGPGVRVAAYAVDGENEIRLEAAKPHLLPPGASDSRELIRVLQQPTRIDLTRFRGRSVALKWLTEGVEPPPAVFLAMPRLRLRTQAQHRPHILFICSDAHRYDYALSDKGVTLMPALQELAESAVVYDQAFSNASWTLPSITSTLTGLFPRHHGTGYRVETGDVGDRDPADLPPGTFYAPWNKTYHIFTTYPDQLTTLTEVLRARGYTTAMVVANELYVLSGLAEDGQDVVVDPGVVPGDQVNAQALVALELAAGGPLFLLVHYMDVHHHLPWYFSKQYPDANPFASRDDLLATYSAAVRDTDRYLQELLSAWDDAVGIDDSLIVFFADHGEHLLDPGRPLLDHGNSMDEVLLHVPLVVKYPARMRRGGTAVNAAVSLVDLFPTVLDVLGIDSGELGLSGRSLLAVANQPVAAQRVIFADYQLYDDELSSVREGPLKLVLNFTKSSAWLVDTSYGNTDEGEPGQVIEDPAARQRLSSAFERYARSADTARRAILSDRVVDQQDAHDRLRSLGYLSGAAEE
jgi:arylsulfatase A-like enzyme